MYYSYIAILSLHTRYIARKYDGNNICLKENIINIIWKLKAVATYICRLIYVGLVQSSKANILIIGRLI